MDIMNYFALFLLVSAIYGVTSQTTPTYPGYPDVFYHSADCIYVKVKNVSEGDASFCPEYSGKSVHGSVTAAQCLPLACQYDTHVNTVNILLATHCYFRLCTTPISETNLKLDTTHGGRDIWIRAIDYCSPNPCQNGGTCSSNLFDYQCACPTGYFGEHCQYQSSSQYIICESANGTEAGCTNKLCTWHTTLDICHHVTTSVVVNGCTFIKTYDVSDGYASVCSGGFSSGTPELNQCIQTACGLTDVNAINYLDGTSCFYRKCSSNSQTKAITDLKLSKQHGGRSIWIRGQNYCNSITCQNGGSCFNGETTYHCVCVPGYEGQFCETNINECDSQPCQNGGTCQDLVNSYSCQCVTGYAGTNCEADIDDCANNPCNTGQCTDKVNGFTCDCSNTGYTGTTCDNDIDECSSNPCTNGQCINQVNSYICDCTNTGYTGTLCEQDIDECSSNPCTNGQCINQVNSYRCDCTNTGYTGTLCEQDIDECSSNPCTNGQCINQVNRYSCDCTNTEYTGTLCEQDNSQNINGANSQSGNGNSGSDSGSDDSSTTAIAVAVPTVVGGGMLTVGVVFAMKKLVKYVNANKKINPYKSDREQASRNAQTSDSRVAADGGLANAQNTAGPVNHSTGFQPPE